mmetsp:Transcript_38657/g.123915  ORF Transcript_38657/g.123915 Transcript_38657/m.123915 type:complete len:148 (+) Transcript_38657:99-542(+)
MPLLRRRTRVLLAVAAAHGLRMGPPGSSSQEELDEEDLVALDDQLDGAYDEDYFDMAPGYADELGDYYDDGDEYGDEYGASLDGESMGSLLDLLAGGELPEELIASLFGESGLADLMRQGFDDGDDGEVKLVPEGDDDEDVFDDYEL